MAASDLGSLCYLAGQVVCESDVQLPTPRGSKRPLEEALTALRKGALLLKHGRHGKPKVHFFRVSACDTLLKWRSASGSVKQVKLRNVSEVVAGQGTEVFRRYPLRDGAASFSLRYRDEDGGSRTLDLTAADPQQLELWLVGLRVVAARLAALGTPVSLAAAPGGGGLPPPDLARRAAARLHAAPGPLCMDAGERTPCDLLAWGAAQRAPAAAPSARSVLGVADDCWQHRAAPAPAPGALRLDAFRAAVGRKHAAVITATGALYAWGEGRGGKLGLGHDQDQAVPQKVRHVLDGRVLAAVACGDDCTAALTDAGELFVWGRLHVDARPQLVPLRVRGELRSRRVVQVSCGPFHCAAVSSDGQLFTWGEGFGGKLGHGDQGNRSEPALVAALAGRQVLEAACGVWHTAAIVVEPEGGPPPQHSPLKGEGSAAAVVEGGGGGGGEGGPPASPAHGVPAVPHHHRNNSTSSAFSEASVFHDGAGGALYTWGGVNESVAFGAAEKRDSNRGCLGHGEADLYRGQLLPSRVGGALEGKQVRHVAAGSHLTVAVTTGGRVFQMGATGASAPAKHCPWEGATLPEPVRGALAGYFIDEVCCGMHHVVAAGRPLDRRGARPADAAPRAAFAWGRGSEGQLGVRGFDDSAAPLLVEGLKGRSVLQVAAGGSNTLAVCEHDVRRWEPESKEEGEAAARVLAALAAEPKAPRTQSGEGDGSNGGGAGRGDSARPGGGRERGGIVRRSFSMIAASARSGSGGSGNGNGGGGGGGGPPALGRLSSGSMHSVRSVGGASAAGSARGYHPSFTQTYSFAAAAPPPGRPSLQLSAPPPHPLKLQRLRSDRTTASSVLSGEFGGSGGGSLPPPAPPSRVVSVGSPARSVGHGPSGGSAAAAAAALRRSTFAGYGGPGGGGGGGFPSARSFTGGGFGGAPSDLSSLSSWQQRPLSDDGAAAELEAAGRRVSSTDLAAALDDARSRSSSVALAEELAEKNRIIERLQIKLEKAQRQQVHTAREREAAACAAALAAAAPLSARAATPRPVADAEEQLREAVKASAGAFRAAQQAGSPPPPLPGGGGSRGSPPGSGGGSGSGRPLSSRSGLRSSGGLGGNDEEAAAQLAALEAMLARKEAHLEGQQRRLAEWAAELQRREAALSWRQAQLAGVAGSGSAAAAAAAPVAGRVSWAVPPASGSPAGSATPAPEPIPSDSPVLAVRTTNGAAPARAPFSAAAASPAAPGSAAGSAGGGTQPGSPSAASATATAASADEWSEEFEEGVFLTFTSDGGAKKLRRIRFNRTLFSATSAKQWYEANKHRLAQPTGTPRLSSAATTPPATAASLASTGGSYPGTPLALAAAAGSVAAASGGGAAARVLDAAAEAQAVAGLLHYRQTSRNLSFDARELATFHERLQAALGQQPPGGGGGGGGSAAARPPSRLGKPPRGASAPPGDAAAGSLPGSPFAAAAATPFRSGGLAEEGSWPPPSGMVTAEGGTPATASPAPPAGGDETSREFGSARSSPLTADSFLPASRDASASAATAPPEPSGLGRRGSGASAASGASSPIRAGGGSRGGSPLAKSRSGASSLGKQQSGGRAELAKFTPRAADAPDAARSASAASSQASPAAEGSGGETQRSASSFSAKMGRIRRSLTGGGSGGKKK